MKRPTLPTDDSWESDDVWNLLDQAPPKGARPSFADDVVRLARQMPEARPWWKRLFAPAPIAGLAAITAALALTFVYLNQPPAVGQLTTTAVVVAPAPVDSFAALQDLAETEALIAVADHLEDFSDQELVNLIGL